MVEISLHNKTGIKVQALIFSGQILVSIGLISAGETCTFEGAPETYDIFLRNGATGWEIARKLESMAKTLTLTRQDQGWYVISEKV